jgi:hypothetical protein
MKASSGSFWILIGAFILLGPSPGFPQIAYELTAQSELNDFGGEPARATLKGTFLAEFEQNQSGAGAHLSNIVCTSVDGPTYSISGEGFVGVGFFDSPPSLPGIAYCYLVLSINECDQVQFAGGELALDDAFPILTGWGEAVCRPHDYLLIMYAKPRLEERHKFFIRGEVNDDGKVNISDAVFILLHLFGGKAPIPSCLESLDANDDSRVDLSDPITVLNALFTGTIWLPPPGICCVDPTEDSLGCSGSPVCVSWFDQ